MKRNYDRRVTALEAHFRSRTMDAPSTYHPTRTADGRFFGTIQDGDAVRVRVARPVTFSRDTDGSWLVFSHDDANPSDDNSIRVEDDTACMALDYVFELLADPDDVGAVVVREPDVDD